MVVSSDELLITKITVIKYVQKDMVVELSLAKDKQIK